MPKPKIVFFDFHNVLSKYDYQKSFDAAIYKKIDQRIFQNDSQILNEWMEGTLSSYDLYQQLAKELAVPFSDLYQDFLVGESQLIIDQNLLDLAKKIRGQHTKVGIISDNVDTFLTHTVPDNNLDHLFDFIFSSATYGKQKYRDGSLFDVVLEKLELDSFKDCLMIDDNPSNCQFFEKRGGLAFVYKYGEVEQLADWIQTNTNLTLKK